MRVDSAFASAVEISALVRSGEASAREVVEAALRRIEALDPALNAFVSVDGERALAAADAGRARRRAAVRGRADRDQGQRARRGLRAQLRLAGSSPATGPTTTPTSCARLREAGFVIVGHDEPAGVRDPADDRAALHGPDPQPVGPRRARRAGPAAARRRRSRPGWSRSRTATTAAARSASPPPAAAWWASSRAAGGSRSGPDLGRVAGWPANGVLTRTVADTAHALDVLAGYEVGDANWAPRPAEPYATALRRDPGKLRVAVTAANPLGARRRPGGAPRPPRVGAELLHGARPRGRGGRARRGRPPRSLELFINVFGPAIALGIDAAARGRAGREPGEDEIEPLSRAMLRAGAGDAVARPTSAPSPQLQALARGLVALLRRLRPADDARPGASGRCRSASATASARTRCATSTRSGRLHALHVAVQRHGPARDLGPGRLRRRRPADRRPDRRQAARRGPAAAGRRADGSRAPLGAPAPVRYRTSAIRARA